MDTRTVCAGKSAFISSRPIDGVFGVVFIVRYAILFTNNGTTIFTGAFLLLCLTVTSRKYSCNDQETYDVFFHVIFILLTCRNVSLRFTLE